VPTKKSVSIDFARTSNASANGPVDVSEFGSSVRALETVSPIYQALALYVDDITTEIAEIFDDLQDVATIPPEVEETTLHRWRKPDAEEANLDRVLVLQSPDEREFELVYYLGTTGFDPTEADAVLTGTVYLDANGNKETFDLDVNLDALSTILDDFTATGAIQISAMPFDGGAREIWYDFDAVAFDGDAPETSLTTYWIFEEGSGALEYLSSINDEEATVFARWDEGGGRYDHHVQYNFDELGFVDDIATNCWNANAAETFDAWAVIDDDLNYYGEIDGFEDDCRFGPVDGHPNPGQDFDNLPAEGEWDDLELGELDGGGDSPLCEDDPFDPDCIPFCDEDPEDPDCVEYCDVHPEDC
jgi:hypothetical protein